jgi:hypothetical protein
MKKTYVANSKRMVYTLFLNSLMILKLTGNNNPDSLWSGKKAAKSISFLLTAGYRMPVNKNKIINSGHGVYIEGGINAGRFIAKDLLLGVYGGLAFQDRLWSTSFKENFSNDYGNAINKEQHFSTVDSAVIYSSANLFKNSKGNAVTMPGCATQSFHNYSVYYGFAFKLPCKYSPVIKVYRGSTRSHYQGDGNIATKQREFNIFELTRGMSGCELGIGRIILNQSKNKTQKRFSKNKNYVSLSAYYEVCNFYNSYLYFDDGVITKKISLQSFANNTFLTKYKNDVSWGIKLFFCMT